MTQQPHTYLPFAGAIAGTAHLFSVFLQVTCGAYTHFGCDLHKGLHTCVCWNTLGLIHYVEVPGKVLFVVEMVFQLEIFWDHTQHVRVVLEMNSQPQLIDWATPAHPFPFVQGIHLSVFHISGSCPITEPQPQPWLLLNNGNFQFQDLKDSNKTFRVFPIFILFKLC